MKKLFVLTIVLVLLAVSVVPAFACGSGQSGGQNGGQTGGQTGKQSGGQFGGESGGYVGGKALQERYARSFGDPIQDGMMPFALVGTIASLDSEAGTVTVNVVGGNTLVKSYFGQDVTLQTTATTRFLLRNPGGVATPITFADLAVGQYVSVVGKFVDDVWTATRITVGASLIRLS